MLVGAGHHETVDAAAGEFGAQPGQAVRGGGHRGEAVVGRRQFCPPGGQCPGQIGVGIGSDQFDPLRAGQTLGGGGHAAHQGGQGGGV